VAGWVTIVANYTYISRCPPAVISMNRDKQTNRQTDTETCRHRARKKESEGCDVTARQTIIVLCRDIVGRTCLREIILSATERHRHDLLDLLLRKTRACCCWCCRCLATRQRCYGDQARCPLRSSHDHNVVTSAAIESSISHNDSFYRQFIVY